jgi:hypothetical protein
MIAPQPKKYGLGEVYRNTSETIARSFNVVNKMAITAEYLADNAIVGAKESVLERYIEILQKFNIDTTQLTPLEIKAQAEAILDF